MERSKIKLRRSFNIYDSLEPIIPISVKRAEQCVVDLWNLSENGNKDVEINEFLNETQAQLQLALFGVPLEFEKDTNKKIRFAFSNFGFEYAIEYVKLINNLKNSNGPLSNAMKERQEEVLVNQKCLEMR